MVNILSNCTGADLILNNVVFVAHNDAEDNLIRFVEAQIGVNAVGKPPADTEDCIVLQADADGLCLIKDKCYLRADFLKLLPRTLPNNLNHELLIKASKFKTISGEPTAVDATAGLGEDSFLLAAAGFNVELFERDPVIAVLLYDALSRGEKDTALAPILKRMRLHIGDSTLMLPRLDFTPDVVVLDPMFPQRKKSGMIKKKFQLLHHLEQPCDDEKLLLDAALSCNPRRIVIKRPSKGAYLAGQKPSYTIQGNSIRYDCIVNLSLKQT